MLSHCGVVRGREEGKEELWRRVVNRPLLPPSSVLSDQAEQTLALWGLWLPPPPLLLVW